MIIGNRRRLTSLRSQGTVRGGLGVALVAGVALLVSGCSGGADLSGEWDFAITIEDETAVGEVDLTQGDEDQINGSGELCYLDECIPASMTGSLSEEGETVVLEAAEGYIRLQGDVSEEAGRLEGDAIASGAEESGTFSAVRASGGTPEAGSEQQREQVRSAVSDYAEALSFDNPDGSEYRSQLRNATVTPAYWSSPTGEITEDFAETMDEGEVEAYTENYELEEFIFSKENSSDVTGTARYMLETESEGETNATAFASPARVVQWGDDWKVLYEGGFVEDPWETLPGTWEVSMPDYEQGYESYSALEPPEFVMEIGEPYLDGEDDLRGFGFGGEAIYNSGASADLEGNIKTQGEYQGDIDIEVGDANDESAPSEMYFSDVELSESGDQMEGEVRVGYADSPIKFTAEKQDD